MWRWTKNESDKTTRLFFRVSIQFGKKLPRPSRSQSTSHSLYMSRSLPTKGHEPWRYRCKKGILKKCGDDDEEEDG